MSILRLLVLAVGLMAPGIAGAAWASEGGVHLYLQPLLPEAARPVLAISSVQAVGADGTEYPLGVKLAVVRYADATRQRLFASGRLPIGAYAGFTFTVKEGPAPASSGQASPAVSNSTVRLNAPFLVSRQRSLVVWLTLRYEHPMSDPSTLVPVFSAVTPPRLIADLAGFVTNTGADSISVFDTRLGQVVAVIDACAGPTGMAVDRNRRRAYVACSKDDEIQAIDVASGEIVERTRVSPGDRPRELALTPDGATLLSVNTGSNSVTFFDALSLARLERLNVGSGPGSILIEPTGRRAFVFNTLSSTLSVIDIAGRSTLATMSTEYPPIRGEFSRRADRLFVIHERSPYMSVLDPRQLVSVTRARLRIGVSAIAVDTVRSLICIAGPDDTTVDFLDSNVFMPLYSMTTRAGVSHLKFEPTTNALYMLSPETRSVVVLRLPDRKVVSEIDVGDAPYAVAIMGEK